MRLPSILATLIVFNVSISVVNAGGITVNVRDTGAKNDGSELVTDLLQSASAVKFGTSSHGIYRNIVIEHITVFDTYRSAIALEIVDGGVMDSILISDIHGVNTGNAIFIRLGDRNPNRPPGTWNNIGDSTPLWLNDTRNVNVQGMTIPGSQNHVERRGRP